MKTPATSGRTSPDWASTVRPSIDTVVTSAVEPSAIVQSPAGSATVPSRVPAVVTVTPPGVPTSVSPVIGAAAGSGRGGTVASSRPPRRAAAQPTVAASCVGWYGISGSATAAPSAGVQV